MNLHLFLQNSLFFEWSLYVVAKVELITNSSYHQSAGDIVEKALSAANA